METYIVGGGLFGRVAKDFLASKGFDSTIIDCGYQTAGSLASGNITKPSWVSGLGESGKLAYVDLEALYGLLKFSPEVALGKTIDLYRVPRSLTIKPPDIQAIVSRVGDGCLLLDTGQELRGRVLVSAGVWSQALVEMPAIDTVVGVSAVFRKENHQPRFSVWAPYKQSISFGAGGMAWFGDGTAIQLKNFEEARRINNTLERAKGHGLTNPEQVFIGYRPYVKGYKSGYFNRVSEHTWVSTGGGKNGIVLAAIYARRFLEEAL